MHRKTVKRYNIPFEAHALTFSCYQRRNFLNTERTCEYLATAINNARKKHRFHLWAYVFMPNHVHMIVWFPKERHDISKVLQAIKQPASRKAIAYLRDNHPGGLRHVEAGSKQKPLRFWQPGGGFDHNISTVAALSAYVDYIHNNPVTKGLVPYVTDWKWSSANDWIEDRPGPIAIDKEFFPLT